MLVAAGAILGGCASSGPQGSTVTVPAGGPSTDPQAGGSGGSKGGPIITLGKRAQSAVEGLVVGAAIGAQAGPIGAAVGAGTFLIYGALTGHTPLDNSGSGGYGSVTTEERREAALEEQIAEEVARGDALEDEIAAELERQEELLRQIEADEAGVRSGAGAGSPAAADTDIAATPSAPSDTDLSERADPRLAPAAPKERQLPLAIFEKEEVTIASGAWGDNAKIDVVKRSLDADQDGKSEQIRYYDATGEMIRKEQDQDFDGRIDTWSTYRQGSLRERAMDSNDDGVHDVWETYANGKMTSREVDRDYDGVRDAFYAYAGDSLASERHDGDNDGNMDLIVTYENRVRVRVEEDRDKNGQIDMWTTFREADGEEVIARIEKDETGDGKPNVFETFTLYDGRTVIAKREEDKNGDGNVDVTSIYEKGKLQRREIADPNMVPL
jgi:hypothetical protein